MLGIWAVGLSLAGSPASAIADPVPGGPSTPGPAPADPTTPVPDPAAAPIPAPPQPADPAPAPDPAATEPAPAPTAVDPAQQAPPPADPAFAPAPAAEPAPAPAASPPAAPLWLPGTQIAAAAERLRVRYGQQVIVNGHLPSGKEGVPLTLEFRPRGGDWKVVGHGTSAAGGAYRLTGHASRSGAIRVLVTGGSGSRAAGTASAVHGIAIDPVLRAARRAGRRALVGGRLLGAGAGKRVVLQRRGKRGWQTVSQTSTRPDGAFHLRLEPIVLGGSKLRIKFPGDSLLDATDQVIGGLGLGIVRVLPGANRAGVPLSPDLQRYAALMAGILGRPLVISTGTNHSIHSVTGNLSDHAAGNAADFGMWANGGGNDSPVGDRIAAAAFIVAGASPGDALSMARRGGAYTIHRDGLRIQVIWKTGTYGNHHTHVHVGVRREG